MSDICTGSKASRCASAGGGQGEWGAACGSPGGPPRPPPPRASELPKRWSENQGCTCMRAGWEGGREEREQEAEGRLPGDCDLGAGPREAKLAAVTKRQIKALGPDSGGKKVLEEMKEQSRPSLCPRRVSHYLFCMTDRHETTLNGMEHQTQLEGQRAGPGAWRRVWGGSAGFVQVAQKMRVFQFLEVCVPWSLQCRVWEFSDGVFQVRVGSPGWRGWLCRPRSCSHPGYTSVEKYSVFRFSSAKEMGGCCR